MRSRIPSIAIALVLVITGSDVARADGFHGAALLVANRYDRRVSDAAPAADLRPVAAALEKRGFTTTVREDVGGDEMKFLIEQFVRSAPTNGVALVYFSGRVVPTDVGGTIDECLLPVDVDPGDVAKTSIGVRRILDLVRSESGAAFAFLVLDGSASRPSGPKASPARPSPPPVAPADNVVLCRAGDGFARSLVARLGNTTVDLATALRAAAGESGGWASALPTAPVPTLREASGPPTEIAEGSEAGAEWVNALGTVFCWCPSGELGTVGTPRVSTVKPGFWLGKYEVTRREFDLVTMKRPRGALAVRPNHPRDGIRYDDILQFIAELNRRERFFGRLPDDWLYALPTESEWEYACRAGTGSALYFGDDPAALPAHANFADRRLFDTGEEYDHYADARLDDGTPRLATVGRYRPNPWGLHDLYGNLWEWTATVEEDTGRRYAVARGGGWVSLPGYCRSGFGHRFEVTTERNFIGFRLMLRRRTTRPDR